jgi:hypothetical protein
MELRRAANEELRGLQRVIADADEIESRTKDRIIAFSLARRLTSRPAFRSR